MTAGTPTIADPVGQAFEVEAEERDYPVDGGMRNRVGPRYIDENQAHTLLNADVDDPTEPGKRDGYLRVTAGGQGFSDPSRRVLGLGYFDRGPASRLFVAAAETIGLHTTTNPDSPSGFSEALVYDDDTGSVATPRPVPIGPERPAMFQGGELFWVVPGVGLNVHAMQLSGRSIDCGSGLSSPPAGCVDGTWEYERPWFITQNRLAWGKILAAAGDLTPASAFDQSDVPIDSTRAGFLNLSPHTGSTMVALRSWKRQLLFAFGSRQVEAIAVNAGDPLLSTRETVEHNYGCGARDTCIAVGQDFLFLDQFGELRALRRLATNEELGVIEEPISAPINREIRSSNYPGRIKGRINARFMHRSWARLIGERYYLFYPRDGAEWPNAAAVWNTARQHWEGYHVFADAMAAGVESDIRGRGCEFFTSHATTQASRIYRMFPGSYSDDGAPITYRRVLRAWDWPHLGRHAPAALKRPTWLGGEAIGTAGAVGSYSVRTSEESPWVKAMDLTIGDDGLGSFPLIGDSSYPLVPASYPLKDVTPVTTFKGVSLDEEDVGDFPAYAPGFPGYDRDFPMYDADYGFPEGRVVQVMVEHTSAGEQFRERGVRCRAFIGTVPNEEEADES